MGSQRVGHNLVTEQQLNNMPCRILVPRPGIKPTPPALEAQSQPLNHQGSPQFLFFRCPQPTLWSSGIKWTFDGISSSWHILKKDKREMAWRLTQPGQGMMAHPWQDCPNKDSMPFYNTNTTAPPSDTGPRVCHHCLLKADTSTATWSGKQDCAVLASLCSHSQISESAWQNPGDRMYLSWNRG